MRPFDKEHNRKTLRYLHDKESSCEMTNRQHALCELIVLGRTSDLIILLGLSHPTAKWFNRKTGITIDGSRLAVIDEARKLLKCEKQLPTTPPLDAL